MKTTILCGLGAALAMLAVAGAARAEGPLGPFSV